MVKLISTFFLMALFIGTYNEAVDVHLEYGHENITTGQQLKATSLQASYSDCDDCGEGCHNDDKCCPLVCNAGLAILVNPIYKSLNKQFDISKSINWYFFIGYHPPSLEQDIKPPFLS
jgi:hypothetical protein